MVLRQRMGASGRLVPITYAIVRNISTHESNLLYFNGSDTEIEEYATRLHSNLTNQRVTFIDPKWNNYLSVLKDFPSNFGGDPFFSILYKCLQESFWIVFGSHTRDRRRIICPKPLFATDDDEHDKDVERNRLKWRTVEMCECCEELIFFNILANFYFKSLMISLGTWIGRDIPLTSYENVYYHSKLRGRLRVMYIRRCSYEWFEEHFNRTGSSITQLVIEEWVVATMRRIAQYYTLVQSVIHPARLLLDILSDCRDDFEIDPGYPYCNWNNTVFSAHWG